MRVLTDKLVLLALCFLPFLMSEDIYTPVICIISAASTSELCQYLNGKKISFIPEAAIIAVSLFWHPMAFMLPLIIYDIAVNRHKACMVAASLSVLYNIIGSETAHDAVTLAVLCVLAVVLEAKTQKLGEKEQMLKELRDSSTEMNLRLSMKNKDLMERQDYEIYVATLKERNRIAREIHDNVGHMLSRSLLQIGALIAISNAQKNTEQAQELDSIKTTLNSAMNSIRESVHNLHDDSVDLSHAVNEAVSEMRKNYNVNVDIDVSAATPSNVKLCFIATVKEAMSNIVKHSNATAVGVTIREHPAFYQLSIDDNGKNNGRINTGGMGLSNMSDRVEALGGVIRISPENGFRIFISIPKN